MLVREFPGEPEMRVSHETIHQSIYVQGRGRCGGSWRRAGGPAGRCASWRRTEGERRSRIPAW